MISNTPKKSDMPALRRGMMMGLVALILVWTMEFTGLFQTFDHVIYDMLNRHAATRWRNDDIVLVRFDQRTVDGLKELGLFFPWPRDIYEPVLTMLQEAAAVYLDVLFNEPSGHDVEVDRIFNAAMSKADNVYMAMPLESRPPPWDADSENFADRMALPDGFEATEQFNGALLPTPDLRTGIKGVGNVTMRPDSDGVIRRNPLTFQLGNRIFPHFAAAHLTRTGRLKPDGDAVRIDGIEVPMTDGRMLIRFPSHTNAFREISFIDLLAAGAGQSGPDSLRPSDFKGKHVFIGYTAKGLMDIRSTPVSAVSPGVWVHCVVLDNLLNKRFLRQSPAWLHYLLTAFLAVGTAVFVTTNQKMTINLFFFFICIAGIAGIEAGLFRIGIWIPFFGTATGIVVAFTSAAIASYAAEGRKRAFIRQTFSRYMDKKIVDYLLENPSLIAPGGIRARCTVFFTDIAGFTTISESVTPEKTARMLYKVLTEMTELIIAHNGVIDKYIGDCIMAFWGAPAPGTDDAGDAVKAALACSTALGAINRSLQEEGIPAINMRFGIHTGDVIAGNLGSERLFDFTVIGDTVNLASRLESANKFFSTRIMISQTTRKSAGPRIAVRLLGSIAVKGKSKAVRIYEVIGLSSELTPEERQRIRFYHRALGAFYRGKFAAAAAAFQHMLVSVPGDGPARFYAERSRRMAEEPPQGTDWRVIRMETK